MLIVHVVCNMKCIRDIKCNVKCNMNFALVQIKHIFQDGVCIHIRWGIPPDPAAVINMR